MAHYIAIIVPADNGDWRVLFPDIAECEARGFNLDEARWPLSMRWTDV